MPVDETGTPQFEPVRSPLEAVAEIRIRPPAERNRRLAQLIERVNADPQVKAWWHASAVNATRRLGMSDHSWVHVQVVVNIRSARRPFFTVEIAMSNSAGIFQVDELLATKLRGFGHRAVRGGDRKRRVRARGAADHGVSDLMDSRVITGHRT